MVQRTCALVVIAVALLNTDETFAQRFLDQLEGVLDAEAAAAEEPKLLPAASPGYLGFVAIEHLGRVEIELVRPESAAERAGLLVGDVITHVDGRAIKSLDQLGDVLAHRFVGERVAFSIVRDGKEMLLRATLAKRPPAASEVDEVPPEPDPFAPEIPRDAPKPKAEVPIDALDALRTLEEVLDAESPDAPREAARPKADAAREKRIAAFESELEAIKRRIRELEREVGELTER